MSDDDLARLDVAIEVERQHLERLERQEIAFEARADQDHAACEEAERCGCPIYVDVVDGEAVFGSARVEHRSGHEVEDEPER